MRIGIIGSGMIGSTLATRLAGTGHEVAVSNTRGPGSLADLVAAVPGLRAATVADATADADVVVLAVPLRAVPEIDPSLAEDRILIDTTNYYPSRDGRFPALDDGSSTSSELVARHFADARVVKAFNTIHFQQLGSQGDVGLARDRRRAIPVAADDAAAKAVVEGIVEDLGFAAVDGGSLADSWRQQPGTRVYNTEADADEFERLLDAAVRS